MTQTTITFKDIQLDCEYEYDAGEPMIFYYRNGDYGHPGAPSTVELDTVRVQGVDISELIIDTPVWNEIEDKLLEEIES